MQVVIAVCPDDDISLEMVKVEAIQRGYTLEEYKLVRRKGCWCLVKR